MALLSGAKTLLCLTIAYNRWQKTPFDKAQGMNDRKAISSFCGRGGKLEIEILSALKA